MSYGVNITGMAVGADYHASVDRSLGRDWTLPEVQAAGGRISRLRLLSDPGFPFWDVSYMHATLPDGRLVRVYASFGQLPKRNPFGAIIADARREGYNAKRLGLLDRGNWSTCN